MEKEKKPFYKQAWWVVLLLVIIVVGKTTGVFDKEESNAEPNNTEEIEEVDNESNTSNAEENNTTDADESNDQQDEASNEEDTLKEHKEITFGEFTVKSITTEIIDDELMLNFRWVNQSGKDKTPFTALGFVDVTQGDDILEETTGAYDPLTNSDILRKVNNGIEDPVEVKYSIVNNESIEIVFGAAHEYDDTKETIKIDIE